MIDEDFHKIRVGSVIWDSKLERQYIITKKEVINPFPFSCTIYFFYWSSREKPKVANLQVWEPHYRFLEIEKI